MTCVGKRVRRVMRMEDKINIPGGEGGIVPEWNLTGTSSFAGILQPRRREPRYEASLCRPVALNNYCLRMQYVLSRLNIPTGNVCCCVVQLLNVRKGTLNERCLL